MPLPVTSPSLIQLYEVPNTEFRLPESLMFAPSAVEHETALSSVATRWSLGMHVIAAASADAGTPITTAAIAAARPSFHEILICALNLSPSRVSQGARLGPLPNSLTTPPWG